MGLKVTPPKSFYLWGRFGKKMVLHKFSVLPKGIFKKKFADEGGLI